jgi:lipopolysaccharide transport system permease protein
MRTLDNTIVISSDKKSTSSFKEIWLYRELFYFFAWRDIKVRYKQTAIGAGWAILQPLLTTIIFSVIFNRVVGVSTGSEVPYPVFAYVGLMYWNLFSSAINTISNSLVSNQGVITKIYFPRLIPPFSSALVSIVDFVFAGFVFLGLLAFFRVMPNIFPGILSGIVALLIITVFAVGFGTFLAAVNVKYRDVKSAVPFIVQILMYASPIIYPMSIIPEKYQLLAYLNPAAGAVSLVRGGLFGSPVNLLGVCLSILVAVSLLLFALWYFRRTEKGFADII